MKKIIGWMSVLSMLIILFGNDGFSQSESNIEVVKLKENFYRLTSKIPYKVNFLAYVT